MGNQLPTTFPIYFWKGGITWKVTARHAWSALGMAFAHQCHSMTPGLRSAPLPDGEEAGETHFRGQTRRREFPMPPILSKPSKAAHLAIGFVTLGSLLMVWSTIWCIWMYNHHTPTDAGQSPGDAPYYWCAVVFFSGLTLFVIGFALGNIGRNARKAEMPPESSGAPTAQPAVTSQPMVAANGQAAVAGQPVIPGQPTAAVQAVPGVAPVAPVASAAPTARVG
jgi:hypothetical protein